MHVVQVVAATGPGGIEQAAFGYARALASVGVKVTTLAALPPGLRHRYAEAGLPLIADDAVAEWWAILDPARIARYRRVIAAQPDTAVVVHSGRAQLLARMAAFPTAPVIAVAHTDNLRHRLTGQALLCVNTRLARRAEQTWQANGRADRHVFAIPNPLSEPAAPPGPAIGDRTDGPLRLGALGQFLPHKGFSVFLRAIRLLRDQGLSVSATLGGDGPERAALQAEARSLDLEDTVRFPGWVTDKAAFFACVDLFCLPSLTEPFGLVVTEAMACGRPVIVTETDGPVEIVTHGETGVIVPRDDAPALAAAIAALAAEPSRRRAMAEAGYRHVRETYCHQRVGALLRNAIGAVLRDGNRPNPGPSFASDTDGKLSRAER